MKKKYGNVWKNYVPPNEDKWEWKRKLVGMVNNEPEYDYYKIIIRRKRIRRRRKNHKKLAET